MMKMKINHRETEAQRRLLCASVSLWLILTLHLSTSAFAQPDRFYTNDGITGLVRRLKRVECGVRVLHIAAHPDDEDSAMIAYLSLGRGARVTYLSLTRGEGGQNSIGPETGEDLGILRTAELLAARKIDGADQLFGREIDFGFSKSPDECFKFWGKENVVEDIVRAIRYTRPHVIICRFQGNAKDGHGQHQASAIAAREAFALAADPNYKPELIQQGLKPWQAQKFYVGSFEDSLAVTTRLDTGAYDPLSGRSYAAIGYHARSQHRSQDMGMIEYETPMRESFYILEQPSRERERASNRQDTAQRALPDGRGSDGDRKESKRSEKENENEKDGRREEDIFDGLQVDHPDVSPSPAEILKNPDLLTNPRAVAPKIAQLLADWRKKSPDDADSIHDLECALGIAVGLRLEAFSDLPALIVGESVNISCKAYMPVDSPIENSKWSVINAPTGSAARVITTAKNVAQYELIAPKTTVTNPPYFFAYPRAVHRYPLFGESSTCFVADGLNYDLPLWAKVGFSFEPTVFTATFQADLSDETTSFIIPIEYRHANPEFGEIREDLSYLPVIQFSFGSRERVVVPGNRNPTVNLTVTNLSKHEITAVVDVNPNADHRPTSFYDLWMIFMSKRFEIALKSHEFSQLKAEIPRYSGQSHYPWALEVDAYTSETARGEVHRIAYPHIRPRYVCSEHPAFVYYVAASIPHGLKAALIPGPQDQIAPILKQIGIEVALLDGAKIASEPLASYDAVVLGPRAYETQPDLVANNHVLLDYVRDGGTLIVQYNKNDLFEKQGVAPYPMKIAHDRVTDETAPVTILEPDHPIFNTPNKITEKDFEGWVQERGLYFWSSWDERYRPLMACNDPGEPPQKGGMMFAKIGKGNYIYTGYAFFRQLPAGVEGATRLFVNMISLGRAEKKESKK